MLSHSESLSRLLLGVCLADELHHSGVAQCGDVTQLVWLVLSNLAQDPPHDLSRMCLWEPRYYMHGGEGREARVLVEQAGGGKGRVARY